MSGLGRKVPTDWRHVERYPLRSLAYMTVAKVKYTLSLPSWHWSHDQGFEGSCVGHGIVMERSITNTRQNRLMQFLFPSRRYDPIHVWNQAKRIDEWPDTNPGDDNGTSVRAGYDICRTQGLSRVAKMVLDETGRPVPIEARPVNLAEGILYNRWAWTIDEIRTAISLHIPVSIGVNWYSNFDRPIEKPGMFGRTDHWIGEGLLGNIRGGHCLTIYGARDDRQAFKLKNSWGRGYPLVFMPYSVMERLLHEDGEAALVTDR